MLTRLAELPLIQAPLFLEEEWLFHGFGLKNISIENYLRAGGFSRTRAVQTRQVHGRRVHVLEGGEAETGDILEGDGFVADKAGRVCWVRTADCVPILLADCKRRVIGAVHAGWKGTAQNIAAALLEGMLKRWGSDPADVKAALGPAIGGHCYPVGSEVAAAFEKAGLYPGGWIDQIWHDKWYLDLAFANRYLLEKAGVPPTQIYVSLACTACDPEKFASYRKEGKGAARQVSFILIR